MLTTAARAQARQNSGGIALPSDSNIREMLAERIDALAGQEDGIGIVVGIVGPQGRKVISYGHLNQEDPRPLNGNTEFEIGSVTKVFTALLLADMVQKHEVSLEDPVTRYLPMVAKIPERNGRSITLVDLATHTSGLPFMPSELPAPNGLTTPKDPAAQFYQFLAQYKLPHETGWGYSNLGYWLIGQALAQRAGMDYESLLRTRVIAPLKLTRTAITPSPNMKADLAVGHNAVLQSSLPFASVPPYGSMAAAGGLVSTVNDLLTFLSATMGYEHSPLTSSMASMLNTRRPIGEPGEEQALGWRVSGKGDNQLIFHDGSTWGYASDMAWDPKNRVGVVVLSNQMEDVSDIAHHLLRPDFPLGKPLPMIRRTEIALNSALLETYAGRYKAQDEGVFRIGRNGDFLTIQLPDDWGLPKLRLRPETKTDFFTSELPLRVTFQPGTDGRVSGLLVHPPRGQRAIAANRMNSDH
jgi:D-alanyl-D-alanine-carboxypeptidase/D-alanyl-D-alanine-endopeptidase